MNTVNDAILDQVANSVLSGTALREFAMDRLSVLTGYDWSGVYVLKGKELVLDAYVGAATDHTRIPVGVGVCGAAVADNENKVIDDVRREPNYLACSLETRSEIVVLIRSGDAILGQLDIDSHEVARFGPKEEAFLEQLAALLADRWT